MKWLPGGWQRTDRGARGTAPMTSEGDNSATRVFADRAPAPPPPPPAPVGLTPEARDVDISAHAFRNLLVGGGVSGFGVVLCAAVLVDGTSTVSAWIWQLVFFVALLYFLSASRGVLSSRGFLFDRSGFYARTQGEIVGVSWPEIAAIGVGTRPPVENKRIVHPERQRALEIYPADPHFAARHPEFDRWLVEERPPIQGLPGVRYRFFLPPLNRLPRDLERAVATHAPRIWVGQYRL